MDLKKYQYGKHQQDRIYDPKGIAPTLPGTGTQGSTSHLIKILDVSGQTNGTSMRGKSTKNIGGECDGRDIRTVPSEEIPDHDLLCAGFPCQSFSVAGKRGGFEDTRGTLFFEIARILRDKRPRHLLLENVKGLLSHQEGETFQTILGVLADLGYRCEWQVLNSKYFGVPQNRERVFIVGRLGGEGRPEVFPIGENGKRIDETLSNEQRKQTRIGGDTASIDTRTGSTARGQHLIKQNELKIRRLIPIECERLQGFPDNWTKGVSDTQRYKTLGNAVTVNVVEAIGRTLLGGVAGQVAIV